MPAGMAPHWQAALPGAPLTMFPDTGHLLFHERPETVAAIAEFVDSCRAERAAATLVGRLAARRATGTPGHRAGRGVSR